MKDKQISSLERMRHIHGAIHKIETFTHGKSKEDFIDDITLGSAVLFQFSVIGEAVRHVGNDILDAYPYPWYRVRSFRNMITHEYFNIKLETVWKTIVSDLPELKELINKIIKDLGKETSVPQKESSRKSR